MKKLLFISTITSMFHLPIWKAFETFGYDVHFADYRDHPFLRINSFWEKAYRKLPKKYVTAIFNRCNRYVDRQILKMARILQPDLIFATKAKYMSNEVLDELRKITKTVNWYPETTNTINSINRLVSHFDYFFEFDKYIVDLLIKQGHKNVYYLPFCGDIDKNAQWQNTAKEVNVVFLGSYHPELYPQRLTILNKIKDLGLEVWGNKAWLDTSLKEVFQGPLVSTTENIKKLYARAKIVIHMDALTTHTGTGLTMRPFDIATAGSMLIAQDDRKELFDFFEDGKELVSFHDENEIREKVKYYLDHEDERLQIAKAGFERTKRENTYLDRIRTVLEIVEKD